MKTLLGIIITVLILCAFYLIYSISADVIALKIVGYDKANIINVIPQGTSINITYNLDGVKYDKIPLNKIVITSYNNHANQTDSTPNIMASNRLVYEGAVAISQDLKEKYKLKFGDLIYIETLQRYYVIEDLMNSRFKNRIDIFSFDKSWSLNLHLKNQRVVIYKIDRS